MTECSENYVDGLSKGKRTVRFNARKKGSDEIIVDNNQFSICFGLILFGEIFA
jgi:hypothetical protein